MCLAVPGKVISLDAAGPLKMGTVDFGGIKKPVCVEWIDDLNIGDYVIVHVGCAISKLDEAEALSTLELLRVMADLNGEPDAAEGNG